MITPFIPIIYEDILETFKLELVVSEEETIESVCKYITLHLNCKSDMIDLFKYIYNRLKVKNAYKGVTLLKYLLDE